jgi:hypothetical protein
VASAIDPNATTPPNPARRPSAIKAIPGRKYALTPIRFASCRCRVIDCIETAYFLGPMAGSGLKTVHRFMNKLLSAVRQALSSIARVPLSAAVCFVQSP